MKIRRENYVLKSFLPPLHTLTHPHTHITTPLQTLPCSESSVKQQQGNNMVIIEEEKEEADGPFSPNAKSKTWDRREMSRMEKANTVDYAFQSEIKSWATPTQNSLVGEGRESPSPTSLDALDGAKSEYPPGLLFTPPRTDPLHRRLGNQMRSDDDPGSAHATITSRHVPGSACASRTNRHTVKRNGVEDMIDAESPLPTGLNAKASNQASKPASSSSPQSQEKLSAVDVVVSELHRGDSIPVGKVANTIPNTQTTMSLTTAAKPSHEGKDEPDVGVNKYIAQMRARGHKRSSSAPISYQPPPPPPPLEPQTQREGVAKTSKGKEKIVSPLHEISYMSVFKRS